MQIYWYWPWPYHRAIGLAAGVVGDSDAITLHALTPPSGQPVSSSRNPGIHIRADLPDVVPLREWTPRWMVDRILLVLRRSSLRGRAVRATDYDVCHVHLPNRFTDAWALRSLRRRLPLVLSIHDVLPHQSRLPAVLETALLTAIYRIPTALVVHHQHLRDLLVTRFRIPSERIVVIPHPIRPFRGDEHLGGGERPTVLFFGTLRRNKGIPVLLEAIRRLPGRGMRFHFAGRGAPELEELVREAAGESDQISAEIGFVSDARRDALYARADLVVLPYTSFTSQSGVLADAYAWGVPVVVSDVGALGHTVRADRTGWVVPPGDAVSLAETVARALADDQHRRRIRDRMRSLEEARSEHAIGARYRDLYERIVG